MGLMKQAQIAINGIDFSEHVSEVKLITAADLELPAYEKLAGLQDFSFTVKSEHFAWSNMIIQDEIYLFGYPVNIKDLRSKQHPLVNPNGWKELCRL